MSIQAAHDKFFKRTFGDVATAAAFLETYLSPELVEQLKLETLRLVETTLVDEELGEHQNDLLFIVEPQAGAPLYLYLLFEHKSYADKWTLLQLLRYMLKLWQADAEANEVWLRPILPIVIYHGDVVWPHGVDFADYFQPIVGVEPFIPQFTAVFKDFSARSAVEIEGTPSLKAVLLALRYILNRNLAVELRSFIHQLFQLLNAQHHTERQLLELIIFYFTQATEKVRYADMKEVLILEGTQGETVLQTIAAELRQEALLEGRQEGRQEGRKEGRLIALREAVYDVLWARFEDVPDEVQEELEAIEDVQCLRQAAVQAAICPTLPHFVNWLEQWGATSATPPKQSLN